MRPAPMNRPHRPHELLVFSSFQCELNVGHQSEPLSIQIEDVGCDRGSGTSRRALVLGGLGAAATACGVGQSGSGQPAGQTPATTKSTLTGPVWILDHPLQMPVRHEARDQEAVDRARREHHRKVERDAPQALLADHRVNRRAA